MANYERGVYEPSDEVRVFDGSEDDDDVEGSRLPLLIVLALLVLAMFGGVVWLAYTQGVARGRGETPVLTAAAGPEKIAPAQAGGNNVPYQGFKIYEQPAPSDDSADSAPAQTPAAQTPVAKADTPPPALKQAIAPVETKPAPVVTAKPEPQKVVAAPPPVAKPEPQKTVAPPAKPVPDKVVAAPKPAASQPAPKSMAALIQQANSTPPPAKAVAAPVPAGPATGAPRQLGTPVPVATKPVAAAKPAASGAYVLQIGAYKSQADADAAWKAYKSKHAALLSGYSPDVQQAELGEKGTWYRLRIAGFGDKDGASATCDRLKADGGNCFLGK